MAISGTDWRWCVSAANGLLVAHADIESFDQDFAGSAIPLELRTDYLVAGRFRKRDPPVRAGGVSRAGLHESGWFFHGDAAARYTLRLDRLGLQNGGARDLDTVSGSLTLIVDDLFTPASTAAPGLDQRCHGDRRRLRSTNAVFPVQLSVPSSLPIPVNFSTADGAAKAGADYTASIGDAHFPSGRDVRVHHGAGAGGPFAGRSRGFFSEPDRGGRRHDLQRVGNRDDSRQ